MKATLWIIIILIVLLGLFFVFRGEKGQEAGIPQPTPTPTAPPTGGQSPEVTATPKEVVVDITDSGFEPRDTVINAGDTVRFMNQSTKARWPASGIHPTHQLYPGSGIGKCNTAEADSIFDACRGLNPGESFSFTFNEKGTWPFHNHLQPSMTGTIVVQ